MFRNRSQILVSRLLAAAFLLIAADSALMAEEYVWARFYGSNVPSGYATNGFGSYYVPKSMVISSKLQTDPIKVPADSKPTDEKVAETKPAEKKPAEAKSGEPALESQSSKPVPSTQKSFWKRLTFRK